METRYLLLIDTDKIKDYVFASSKLKEIRGASMLLEYLNYEESKRIIENRLGKESDLYDIIYLDGGSGKIEFKHREDAIACAEEIQKTYREKTRTATVTWEVVEIQAGDNYYNAVAKGEYLIRKKKQSGKTLGQCDHIGIVHRCSHNGIEMVEDLTEIASVNKTYRTLSSYTNEKVPKVSPSSIMKHAFLNDRTTHKESIRDTISKKYISEYFEWPKQLSVIGSAAGNGDIGLLYFDGNSMNRVLKTLGTKEQYRDFSGKLRNTIENALQKTVESIYPLKTLPRLLNQDENEQNQQKVHVLPIDFILNAGDDIIVVVPSTKAMEFAEIFMREFAVATKTFTEDGLTMSAGIVIAKSSFPIKYLVPLAEQLLKSAKKKNYKQVYNHEADWKKLSTMDYMVVSASSNPNLESVRKQELFRTIDDGEYVLTTRPFQYEEWVNIKDIIQKMQQAEKPFPKTKMKGFYHTHFMEKWEADYHYSKYYINLPNAQKQYMKELYSLFEHRTHIDTQWFEKEDKYYSPLIDVFEIYKYV
ncbi:TPA: hypothetical protein ACGW3F_003157 [Bacillus paranthracis]